MGSSATPGPLVICPDCAAHHRMGERCPFCRAEGTPSRGRSMLERLGLGLMHTAAVVGISTTMVACYGGPADFYNQDMACSSNADCMAGEVCNGQLCVATVTRCTTDTDCAGNEVCRTFYVSEEGTQQVAWCQPASSCRSQVDCATGQYCGARTSEFALGTCIDDAAACNPSDPAPCAIGACVQDSSTGSYRCIDEVEPECTDAMDCPIGQVCSAGSCIEPPAECVTADDCASGEQCVGGACRPETQCDASAQCEGASEQCVDGACVVVEEPSAAASCVFDRQCGEQGTCIDARCHVLCTTEEECSRTEACVDGVCQAAPDGGGECVFDSDCVTGPATCINGFCAAHCTAADAVSSCDAGERCTEAGVCRPDRRPVPECRDSGDCEGGQACVNALCRTECTDAAQCPAEAPVCDGGFCSTEREVAPECTQNADCSAGGVCRDGACH